MEHTGQTTPPIQKILKRRPVAALQSAKAASSRRPPSTQSPHNPSLHPTAKRLNPNDEASPVVFVIGISSFFRHSSLEIRDWRMSHSALNGSLAHLTAFNLQPI